MINFLQPSLGIEELTALEAVFKSNWVGKGASVAKFEAEFASRLDSDPSRFLSTTCCTEGLFLVPKLFGFGAGDEVVVPSISYIAVGSSVISSGASLVPCDVDPRSLNARAEDIEEKLTRNTKAVILNHYGGVPCDMGPILDLCRNNDIVVVEDSACAVTSSYKGQACGTIGDMGLWSFDAMKVITTGDGGMMYLDSEELMEFAKEYLYLGLPAKKKSGVDSSTEDNSKWWEIEVNNLGRRAIMNNVAGAIGLSQLAKIDVFIARRQEIFELYVSELTGLDWLTLPLDLADGVTATRYFFWVQLEQRDALARFLLDRDIYTTFRYWPLHRVSYFDCGDTKLLHSDFACECTLNLPLHQSLSDDDVLRVIEAIKEFGLTHI